MIIIYSSFFSNHCFVLTLGVDIYKIQVAEVDKNIKRKPTAMIIIVKSFVLRFNENKIQQNYIKSHFFMILLESKHVI